MSHRRGLKALVNKLKYYELSPEEVVHLTGWIAYVRSVEPDFVKSLEAKYSLDLTNNSTWV